MYQYSLFCNAVIFSTDEPEVPITALSVSDDELTIAKGSTKKVIVSTTPAQANTPTITVASNDTDIATATISGREITITGVDSEAAADGEATITVTAGNVTATIDVTVPYVAET